MSACSSTPEQDSGSETTKTLAVCRFCGCGCGVICEAKDSRLISVTGDPDNQSNKGLNCVKGYHLAKVLYGQDRLLTPLIRDDTTFQQLSTMRTRTSASADKLLLFKPNTDLAIANCIANYLIQENKYDADFVTDHLQFKQGTENIGNATDDGYDASEIGQASGDTSTITFEE